MDSMKCFECVLKHIATALSYGKEILSGHTMGNELDHRIDFLGEITNAQHHIELIDDNLFVQISNYRKQIQSKKILIDVNDLAFLRQLYIKVEAMEQNKTDIIYEEMDIQPNIIYYNVTNKDYFDLSYKSIKNNLKGYSNIYVLNSEIDLKEYEDVTVLNKTLYQYSIDAQDFILMYENTGVLKNFQAKKIANSFSMKLFNNFETINYLKKLGVNRNIFNYDRLKPCKIKSKIFNQVIKNYNGDNPITVYCYLGNQTTNLNDNLTTVFVDRPICCSTRSSLKEKDFVRWNQQGFESLRKELNF